MKTNTIMFRWRQREWRSLTNVI